MLVYRIDVLKELKKKGYTSTRMRNEKILSESAMSDIRKGKVTANTLDVACRLLGFQPGTIIKYVPDTKDADNEES